MGDYGYYNKHYLKTREDGCITDAFSDGPLYGNSTDGYICFNDKGGYQLRLIIDGEPTEENPPLCTIDGIPLYHWDGEKISKRQDEDIQAEIAALPEPGPSPLEQLRADVEFLAVMTGTDLL